MASLVQIRQAGVRSINVEQDLQRTELAEGYILTAQARRSLLRILDRAEGAALQRAWTLTGPYGSGKSYFGLYLMNLLSLNVPSHLLAQQKVEEGDSLLAEKAGIVSRAATTRGLLPIAIAGYRAPIQECIRKGIRSAIEPLAHDKGIRQILEDEALWREETQSRRITEILAQLLDCLDTPDLNYAGILLVLDEMGKLLEYATAHPDASDMYLLQEIAELANRSGEQPLLFVGMLHQSFERYAGHADSLTQREWAKIQGRFEDIAFQESPTQQMWLLANALEYPDRQALDSLWPESVTQADEAIETGWCPPMMKEDDFRTLCRQTVPFHPTATVALPYLFQRLAQNERSMFAYLTSSEPCSFQAYLNTDQARRQVRLADLFDYLAANYQGRLYSALRTRSLTETRERLGSLSTLSLLESDLLKNIGLLNWLSEISPFPASLPKLLFAMRSPEYADADILAALEKLRNQSTIVFRRYNQTYAIWQGSDVDVEERLEEARQRQIATFSTAQAVQRYLPPQPMVARKHSYQTGTTRLFALRYVDGLTRETVSLTAPEGASGLVLLCLSESSVEAEEFVTWAQSPPISEQAYLICGVLERTPRLTELMGEMRCLHWVRDNTPELRDDPVARRELRTRLSELETLVRAELDRTTRLHRRGATSARRWFYRGVELDGQKRGLSPLLSQVCDQLYADSPRLRNEILNRRQLSSQGAAARRNLVEAILQRADQPRLGIEGYPPERSMYESILQAGGLHREDTPGVWSLHGPPEEDSLGLGSVWQALSTTIFGEPPGQHNVQELFDFLSNPPYGLSAGVLPLILCQFLQGHKNEITLYSEGSLVPEPGIADWEVLLRRPELFAVAGCRIVGPRRVVIERLAQGLQTEAAAMPVVRELIRQMKSLPEHAWRTQQLSAPTLAARRAIETARSPESLIFHELPGAFGLPPFTASEDTAGDLLDAFFGNLNAALQELSNAMPKLLAEARDHWLHACGLPVDDRGWQQFLTLAKQMSPQVHQPPLAPVLLRAAQATNEQMALESVLAYVANRPCRSWNDSDREQFPGKAIAVGRLFQQERNGLAAQEGLTEGQRSESRRLAAEIRTHLDNLAVGDPLVLQAALQLLVQGQRAAQTQEYTNGRNP